ncbi:hypothetical protein EVAR_103052_1 [Eumeta japonica]|uniref:Fatty acyl-CoA reductase n=1 Tax=Eumeta variegata TaxID=151549 RepID=A0A4C1WEY0_EUMVA|nr:hypothetical protein EVAR_103052_1 [Eumeta japonica]
MFVCPETPIKNDGLMMMTFRGAFRTLHSRGQCIVDLIPVDMVVNNCILAAWRTGTGRHLLTHSFQLFFEQSKPLSGLQRYFGIYQSSAVGRLMQTQHQVGHIDPHGAFSVVPEHFLRQIPFCKHHLGDDLPGCAGIRLRPHTRGPRKESYVSSSFLVLSFYQPNEKKVYS